MIYSILLRVIKKDNQKFFSSTKDSFETFLNPKFGEQIIKDKLKKHEKNLSKYLSSWLAISKINKLVYPSQGLLLTPHDGLSTYSTKKLTQKTIIETLRLRLFFLELFNHPHRISYLDKVSSLPFIPPPEVANIMFTHAFNQGLSLSIGDIGASVGWTQKPRVSRKDRYASGPFVKLGRQARTFFCGSASPDVWNTSMAIATMAASHCLAGIPRNGVLSDIKRQSDLAAEVFTVLDNLAQLIFIDRSDREQVTNYWKKNVMGVVEATGDKALKRTQELYKSGVRCFRIYSPEPGIGPIDTVKEIRKHFGNEVEIFTGQIVDVEQAVLCQDAGADGLYVGIGGGGRCITGVRSGATIDWPELIWRMRGKVKIPVIVEGGASDHVAISLLLGASGIGVSRIAAGGTIESPGGVLYCVSKAGKYFKPYGGEASARTKFLDGKLLPFGAASFVEGETTNAEMSYIKGALPTLTYNLHSLIEDSVLALVFHGADNITQLQAISPSPLRQITYFGQLQQKTH